MVFGNNGQIGQYGFAQQVFLVGEYRKFFRVIRIHQHIFYEGEIAAEAGRAHGRIEDGFERKQVIVARHRGVVIPSGGGMDGEGIGHAGLAIG